MLWVVDPLYPQKQKASLQCPDPPGAQAVKASQGLPLALALRRCLVPGVRAA